MLKITSITFVKSITDIRNRPEPFYPEFAFAGRSNVGKSSLINCLLNRRNLARISKSPGKTRTINYYLVNDNFYLVDLPGYGFARVPPAEQKKWQTMIEKYLVKNSYLRVLYVLIDSVTGMKKNDIQLFEWLHFQNIYYRVILTKSDRIGTHQRQLRMKEINGSLPLHKIHSGVLSFSARDRSGRDDLLNDINTILRNSPPYY
jgi:GTP-binding protein